jgi:hypothetical protein
VIPGEREGVVRIFTTANTANIQEFQEIAQLLRTVVDIRRIFTNNALSAIVLRADAAQIGLAEPLFDALDQPADAPKQHRVSSEFLLAGDKEGVTRVFFVANAATIQAFQEMAQLIRTAVEVRRTFTLNAPKAIIVRGTADQVAMAEWLLNEADQASTVMPDQAVREYRTPGAGDLAVRVFYVPGAASIQDFQRIAQQVRGAQGILKVSQYNDRRLLTVKGTTAQIAAAERVIKESTLLSKQ